LFICTFGFVFFWLRCFFALRLHLYHLNAFNLNYCKRCFINVIIGIVFVFSPDFPIAVGFLFYSQ